MQGLSNLSLSERKIIVGIDFGTTYSGLAWAETRRPDHIHVVDTWPSSVGAVEGASSVKVPSELRYTNDGYQWGFQIPGIVDRYQWFKLGLDKEASKLAAGMPKDANRDPETLLRDYLTALGRHLIYVLEQKLGAAFRTIPLEYVLTVPAIWSEVAKSKTLKACQAAGLKTDVPITLVSEPEAAAMYTLHELSPHGLVTGDSFVLCDAGGGTVDLISYTITKMSPTLEIKEAAAGSGALCGSTFLNRRFGEFLTSKLGKEPGWDAETLAEAMERFETLIKKQYSPSTYSESSYGIPVPGLANNEKLGIKRGKFNMKPSDLKAIFEPIVTQIIKLVKDQIKASNTKIKAVLLVGGFGQNNYLKEQLRIALGSKIEVMQPPHAWTAVVQGAVMKGLATYDHNLADVVVGGRTARKHYGSTVTKKFDPAIHSPSTKRWSSFYGEYRATCMRWFINKGDPVIESVPFTSDFCRRFPVSDGLPKSVSSTVYSDSASPLAPLQLNDNVVELVRIEASLSSVTTSWPQAKGKDGKMYYTVDYSIEASYGSALTEYTLICEGKRYKTVTAEYV